MRWIITLGFCLSIMLNCSAHALSGKSVPVFEGDVDRAYVVVGEVNDNLRKHFAFQADPTKEQIYAEIWERAQKMKADAVIHAKYGETRRTLFNNGRTPISGTAIRYTDAGEKRSEGQPPGEAALPASNPPSKCTSLPVI